MKKIDWKNLDIKELAILISSELKKNNIDTVLVGGACVTIYTSNKYLSMDIDYVTHSTIKDLKQVMEKIGFYQKSGRHFEHPKCRFFIEFLPPPVSIGNEIPVTEFNHIKSLKLFTPSDCVKDRLSAYYHWNDPQSLDQALMVAKSQKINIKEIKKWSEKEGNIEKYYRFEKLLSRKC